jgi:sugar lactone lactonase YvrE
MKRMQFIANLAAAIGLLASTSVVNAEPILYATTGGGSTLVRIDVGAGIVTEIGPFGVPAADAIAISPQGKLYTVTQGYPAGGVNPQLARVDPVTGLATPFGVNLNPEIFMGIGFSPEGTLYGVNSMSDTPDTGSLYQFNPATGQAAKVGVTGGCGVIMDIAFAPDGTMYGVDPTSLYRINQHTGRAKLVTKLHDALTLLPLTWVMGLAIDDDGTFYVSEIVPNAPLRRVDPVTGAATAVAGVSLSSPHGLEFIPTPRSRPISIAFKKSPVDANTWVGSVDTDLDGVFSDGSLLYEQISSRVTGKTVHFAGIYTVETPFYSFTARMDNQLNLNNGSIRGNGTVVEGWMDGTQVHLEADLVPGGVAGVMQLMPGSGH